MNFRDKLRDKLRQWLFGYELQKFEEVDKNYEESKKNYEDAKELCKRSSGYLNAAMDEYLSSRKLTDDCHKLLDSMISVGTDVAFHSDDHSWAVVCIKGHPEYVKFIPLSHKDARDILEFLNHFKYSNIVVDSPLGFRDMVEHCIMDDPFK